MKNKRKMNLSIDCDEISQMEASVYSQIGKDGLRFLKHDIHVGIKGLTTISGHQLNVLLPMNKETLASVDRTLGRGSACIVQEGIYQPLGIRVAIKTINVYDRDKRHQIMNDMKVLLDNLIKQEKNGHKCEFIVTLYGAYYDQGSVKVILQLMDGGSLADIINVYRAAKIQPHIDQKILAKVAIQILCGISYLHSNNILHRDIKPANILLNAKGQVKLTDFGISREFVESYQFSKTFIGTRAYMSPQRIDGKPYTYSSDIWSFGLLMYQLATSQFPYEHKSYVELRQQFISKGTPSLPQRYSDEFRNFVESCLSINPKERASALQLLGHKWILKNISNKVSIKRWLMEIKDQIVPLIEIR